MSGSTGTLCGLYVVWEMCCHKPIDKFIKKKDRDAHLPVFAQGSSKLADQAWQLHLTCNHNYKWSSVQPFFGCFLAEIFSPLYGRGVPNGGSIFQLRADQCIVSCFSYLWIFSLGVSFNKFNDRLAFPVIRSMGEFQDRPLEISINPQVLCTCDNLQDLTM